MSKTPETGLDDLGPANVDLLRDELRDFVSGYSQLSQDQTHIIEDGGSHNSHTSDGGGGGGGGGWC